MGLLGADSELVTIKGLLWDCDVSPRTERRRGKQRAEKDEREVEVLRETTGGLTKKTSSDDPQMAPDTVGKHWM